MKADTPSSRGKLYELAACRHLAKQGLQLIEENYRCHSGEIDLIMQDGEHTVFIEVRYRSNLRYGGAAESVDKRKQDKLIKTALHYLQTHKRAAALPARFDVVTIQASTDNDEILWIKNAF